MSNTLPVAGEGLLVTEEGKTTRIFRAYPMNNTARMLIFAGALMLLVLLRTFYFVATHVALDGGDVEAAHQWTPPQVAVANLSEAVLGGLASGRTGSVVYALDDRNRALMASLQTPCATPWLEHAWAAGRDAPPAPGPGASAANVLTVAGSAKPLLNAAIAWRSGETLLIVAPFKYRSARDTRMIAGAVAVAHTRGVYETQSLEEAFCVQELYDPV